MNVTERNQCRPNVLDPVGGSSLQVVLAYFLPCLIFVGLVGNGVTLITLNLAVNKQSRKTSLFLSSKSLTDFAVGIFSLLMNLNAYSAFVDNDAYSRFYQGLFKPTYVILNWLLMSSTWYAVAVTFERMFAIGWPLQARHTLTTRLLFVSIVGIAVLSFVYTLYPLIYLTNMDYMDCARPGRRVYLLAGPFSKEQPVLWYYGLISRYIHHILATVLPVILLFIFNTVIVLQLRHHAKSLARFTQAGYSQHDANEQVRVSFLVFTITAATAIFLLPSCSVVIYDTIYKGIKPKAYQAFVHVANMMVLCDKVLDFFLYCLVSSSFRNRLVAACKSGLGERRKQSNRSQDTMITSPTSVKKDRDGRRRSGSQDTTIAYPVRDIYTKMKYMPGRSDSTDTTRSNRCARV